ncbi:MAG: acyl-CoA thioesterase [Chthoniobacterales bacterium]
MNLWLRLAVFFLTVRFRSRCSAVGPTALEFRVLPSDLDLLGHMNNGKYLTVLDICRLDLMTRSGLWRESTKRRWYPVVAAQTIQFRRSLYPFEKFQVNTEVVGWDEKYFFIRHQLAAGNKLVALAFVAARFLGPNSARVSPQQILETLKQTPMRPETPLWLTRWIEDLAASA